VKPIIRIPILCALAAACVEREGPEPVKIDDGFIKENLLSAAPAPRHAVNADLGGKVIYLGADVDRERASVDDRVKVTHYWKVVEPPGPEWRLFTHVNGGAGDWINVDDTRMRKMYGPDKWKAGDLVRDEQVFPIVKGWKSPDATIYVGMFRKGGQTEGDRMPVRSGPSDGKGRVKVATIAVGGAAGAARPAAARRASAAVKLDGKADEPDWARAEVLGPFVPAEGGAPVAGAARARLLWDDANLYAFIEVEDPDVASGFTKHDDPLWKEDCVELFIDADGSGRGYVELQVNPRGAVFDAWFPTVRPESDVAWSSGMKAKAVVDGTLDKRDDADQGWAVEIAIPLEAVKGKDAGMKVTLPPKPGDVWKLNLVRVDKPKDGAVTASAWAPIGIGDFHALDRLRAVTFEP
jgi:hypothetical protein